MSHRKIVITGLGIVSPLGIGLKKFWKNALKGQSVITPSAQLKHSFFEDYTSGNLENFSPKSFFSERQIKKVDRFTQYALIACQEALDSSEILLEKMNRERMGVYVGNQWGGWEFTETQLRNLHLFGSQEVNPYLATAWFPAAPQGEISIKYGLKGHSKTIDSGRTSGLTSINQAIHAIQTGRLDYALAGGTEAMLTPFMMTANFCSSSQDNYQPFGKCTSGDVPAEGAGFVFLESWESAKERNATIYAEIKSCHHFQHNICETLEATLDEAHLFSKDIPFILAEGAGTIENDFQETYAFSKIFSSSQTVISTPKSMFGHAQGAAGALDVIMGALSLTHQCILPTINKTGLMHNFGFPVITNQPHTCALNHLLIHNRDPHSGSAAMVISRI